MDLMNKSKALKLRSNLDKYLIAKDDNRSVCVKRNCITRRSTWIVEPSPNETGGTVRLKSYASGLYLAASGSPSPLGMTGKRVVQSPLYEDEDEDEDEGLIFEWEPIREGLQIKLKACGPRGKFLRANSGPPPWNNSVTHDAPANGATKFWTLWEVVPMEMPEEPPPTWAEIDLLSLSPSTSISTFSDQSDEDLASGSYPAESMVCPWSPRLSMNKSAMDIFSNAKAVRLRSHHDKYLTADDDEESVTQDRNASSRNARWSVEFVSSTDTDDDRPCLLRLKSRHGKYLTASEQPYLLGMTGRKVLQSLPRRLDSSVEWEPIRDGKRVKLRSRYGNFLRANGGLPPWRNSITHDVPHRSSTQDWVLWNVDVVDILPTPNPSSNKPQKPMPIPDSDSFSSNESAAGFTSPSPKPNGYPRQETLGYTPPRTEGRVIYYHIAEEDGKVNEEDGQGYPLTFKGNSVKELTRRLREDTGIQEIIVCTRSPSDGKLYPLCLDLPPTAVSMHVVVVPTASLAAS